MKKNIKIILDIIMFVLIILEFQRGLTGPLFHEIIGISLAILFGFHNVLNINYYTNIFKGKYNTKRIFMTIINTLFALLMIITLVTGIMSSTELFGGVFKYNETIVTIHHVISYWSLILLGIHIGINLTSILQKVKKGKLYNIIAIVIIIFGVYSFISLNIMKYLFGFTSFGAIGNPVLNILKFSSIVLSLSFIINAIYTLKKKIKTKKYSRSGKKSAVIEDLIKKCNFFLSRNRNEKQN